MPIYAYRCDSCGFEKDHLQRLSDPLLSVCPECGVAAYAKQVTAAGFLLKGNGWYATDFKGGAKPEEAAKPQVDKPQATESAPPCQGCPGAEACAGS
jgi:putative FmdB family regulatory protein